MTTTFDNTTRSATDEHGNPVSGTAEAIAL
jgi:hypothetical protein